MIETHTIGAPAPSGSLTAAEVFIYYRIQAADQAETRQRVADFQSALCSRFAGLRARLLRRHDEPGAGSLLTMMEIYGLEFTEAVVRDSGAAEFLDAIREAAASIAPMIQGERHVEVFEPCA